MTIIEYEIRFEAATLKSIDEQEKLHALAWAIKQAGAKKKNGKSVYRNFKQFFNRKNIEKKLLKKSKNNNFKSNLMQAYKKTKGG